MIGCSSRHSSVPRETPLILFGAFDRHNLGDILLAHVAARQAAPRPVVFAGLARRDLAIWGGQRVSAITDLAREWGDTRADVMHVGGELLTCDLYQAAVMLQSETDARATIARFDADPAAGLEWAMTTLGLRQGMAYLAPKSLFRNPGRFTYRAVGGVGLDRLSTGQKEEVRARLREADAVTARDRVTESLLAKMGIQASLEPDPVSLLPRLFGATIARHAGSGEPAQVKAACPAGYIVVQFAAEYGDDASLSAIARYLDRAMADMGLDIVLFRAGAAPWHDDPRVYQRLAGFMGPRQPRLFHSLNVWDICALLAGAKAYCGTSLHGWILSRAMGVEARPFPVEMRLAKQFAYADTWGTRPHPA